MWLIYLGGCSVFYLFCVFKIRADGWEWRIHQWSNHSEPDILQWEKTFRTILLRNNSHREVVLVYHRWVFYGKRNVFLFVTLCIYVSHKNLKRSSKIYIFYSQMIYFRKKYWQRNYASWKSVCIFMSVYSFSFSENTCKSWATAVSELTEKLSLSKTFLQTFPCLLNLLQTILLMKQVCTELWHMLSIQRHAL